MGDFCVDYINRQRTSYMNFIICEAPVDHLNSASENTETQENLERKVSTRVSTQFDHRINQIQQKSTNVTHNLYT